MFFIRAKSSSATATNQESSLCEISAQHQNLPRGENWAERWCVLPVDFENLYERIFNFEVRDDDVFVVTFMKSGTTWMQETAWLLMNNLDFITAKSEPMRNRSKCLDIIGLINNSINKNTIELCNAMPSPRLIKTHMPANLVPQQVWQKKPKIIYVARNAKDVVVSSYHFLKGLGRWNGTMHEYVEAFVNNDILYSPFWAHIVDFWKLRHESHIFFVTYEEMKRDLAGVLQRLCKFLGRPELNADELKLILHHLSFEQMKSNKQTNLTHAFKSSHDGANEDFEFMRRGIVGSYKDELSPEHQRDLNIWSKAFLEKHGIKEEDIFGNIS